MLQLKDDKVPIDYTMPVNWDQFTDNQYTPLMKILLFYFVHPDMILIKIFTLMLLNQGNLKICQLIYK